MRLEEFRNALRILICLDADELVSGGFVRRGDHDAWNTFRSDPFRWMICADEQTARKLFALIEMRQQPMFKTSEGLRIDDEAAP